MRKLFSCAFVLLLQAAIASCGTAPTLPQASDGGAARITSETRIGFAISKFDPVLSLDGDARPGQYALGGALRGAAECSVFTTLGGLPGLVLSVACLPFGVTIGAVAGAQKAAPGRNADAARSDIGSAAKDLQLRPLLTSELERYAKVRDLPGLVPLHDEGPRTPAEEPRYTAEVDVVLELSINEIRATTPASVGLPYRFIVSAKGRLVRVRDGGVLARLSTSMTTDSAAVGYWTADGGAALASELRVLMRKLAQSSIDELLLVYRGEAALPSGAAAVSVSSGPVPRWGGNVKGEDEQRTPGVFPPYVLRPVDPPVGVSMRFAKRPMFALHLDPAPVTSLRPTLAWEKLPPSIPPQLFEGTAPRATDLVYEVEVHAGSLQTFYGPVPVMAAADIVQRHAGVREPQVQLDELLPCRYYFWSVRAHLNLDGRRRVTEWSGAYLAFFANADPRSIRLPESSRDTLFPVSAFFFPFQTPSADGKPCATVW